MHANKIWGPLRWALFVPAYLTFAHLQAAAPPDTPITNTATVTYDNDLAVPASSSVTFNTATDSQSAVNLLQLAGSDIPIGEQSSVPYQGTSCSTSGSTAGPFVNLDLSAPAAGTLVPGSNISVVSDPRAYASGDLIFVQVTDYDQNLDANARNTLEVTLTTADGDQEVIRLNETDLSTGLFIGAIQAVEGGVSVGNCILDVAPDSQVAISYTDADNVTDTVFSIALIDPFGVFFDSLTGELIDGVEISLLATATGELAEVYSPNGIDRWPSTVISGEDITDSSGTVFPIAEGEYRFPRIVAGDYYFEVTLPQGYLFPSIVPNEDLQLLPGAPYVLDVGSRGEVFPVPAGPDVQLDIPLDPIIGSIAITKTASVTQASPGDFVQYSVSINNIDDEETPGNTLLLDTLPEGLRYQEGTMRLNGLPYEPESIGANGRSMTIDTGILAVGGQATLTYFTEVTIATPIGLATNQIVSANPRIESNTAAASISIFNEVFSDTSFVIGRVTAESCESDQGLSGIRVITETGESVVTDAEGRWSLKGLDPGKHLIRLDDSYLPAGSEVHACTRNIFSDGDSPSVVLDLAPGTLWSQDYYISFPGGNNSTSIVEETKELIYASAYTNEMPNYGPGDFSPAEDDTRILWPAPDSSPRIGSIRIAVEHSDSDTISVLLNGSPVPPLNFDGKVRSLDESQAISIWKGVDIPDGVSRLEVINDRTGEHLQQEIYFTSEVFFVEFVEEESRLKADGVTPPLVAVRLTDSDGHIIRPGTGGIYEVSSPYEAWRPDGDRQRQQLLSESRDDSRYQVVGDGIAYLALEPTSNSGLVRISVPLAENRTEMIEAWLEADARDWMLVGLAESMWGSERLESQLLPLEDEDNYYRDGRIAFFGKGRIKGDALMTIAYDTAKESQENPDELFSAIDPDEYYSVYGDDSTQHNEAPSSRKLYLKVEKQKFYALFGDYRTDLVSLELAQYNRTLNGVKTEYQGEYLETNLFASETSLANVRDEIEGRGLSGPYNLSRTNVVDFSEQISLEVRDRFQTGEIISRSLLTRDIDYEIDYRLGTLRFRFPVPVRDVDFNPVFVVANYETQDPREAALVAGGRIELSTADDSIELGMTHVVDQHRGSEGSLSGLDTTIELSQSTEFRAEISESESTLGETARAWQVRLDQQRLTTGVQLYVREVEAGFGFGQQNASEVGTQKVGVDAQWRPSEQIELSVDADQLEQTSSGDLNRQANIQAQYRGARAGLGLGYRWAEDESAVGIVNESELVTAGVSYRFFDNLRLDYNSEFSLNETANAEIFPERNTIGLEYQILGNTYLYAAQETTSGSAETESSQIGLRTSLWRGSEINLGVDQRSGSDGDNLSSALAGLTQRLQINEQWSVDFAFDQGKDLSMTNPASGLTPDTPPTQGTSGNNYKNSSVGLDWRGNNWAWSNRIESRQADSETLNSFRTGLLRDLKQGKALLSTFDWSEQSSLTQNSESLTLSFSHADRSNDSYSLLNRLDLSARESDSSGTLIRNQKIVTNNHLNLSMWENSQLSLMYGAKYVLSKNEEYELSGFTDAITAQYRYFLGDRWDLGVQASSLTSHNSNIRDYSYGASVGVTLLDNLWIQAGYNFEGFEDGDFDSSSFTKEGPYIALTLRFDERSIARVASAFNGRPTLDFPDEQTESQVTAAELPEEQPSLPIEVAAVAEEVSATPNIVYSTAPVAQRSASNSCTAGTRVRVIQLAAFNELGLTQGLIDFFGFENAFIERYEPEDGGQTVYRLIVGPYTESKEELAEAAAIFEAETGWAPWIKDKDCSDLRRVD